MKKIAALFAGIILAVTLLGCGGGGTEIPRTATRTDLKFAYYGTMNTQAADTRGFVNVLWEANFQGIDKAIDNILTAKIDTVLSLGDPLFTKFQPAGRNYRVHAEAETRLRTYFQTLKDRGALKYVVAATPFDEPNTNVESVAELRKSVDILKKVAAEFPELANLQLVVIYAAKPATYDAIELFDIVGIDDGYDTVSGSILQKLYPELKTRLRSNQRTIVIPGGAFGQDIAPFINYAHSNPEVIGVVAFTWLDPIVPKDNWIGLGNDKNPLKQQYIEAGKLLINAGK